MDRPYVICHMMSSLDGKIIGDFMNQEQSAYFYDEYGRIMMGYASKACMMGRVTIQEMGVGEFVTQETISKEFIKVDYIAKKDAPYYTVAVDPSGRLDWTESRIQEGIALNGEHVIEIITEKASSAYLSHLQSLGISYIFGGKDTIDFSIVLEKLKTLFSIENVLVAGGSILNGLLLDDCLIDEVSLVVMPFADGTANSKTVFELDTKNKKVSYTNFKLKSIDKLENSGLWLTYIIEK